MEDPNRNILLVSHTIGYPGPVNKFYTYLSSKYNVYLLLHPIHLDSSLPSSMSYKNKKIKFKLLPPIQYFLEGLLSFFFIKNFRIKNIDLAICFDSLSFFHIFTLRHFVGIKKIVYYNVDYSKKRYQNRLLNYIYQKITLFGYIHCDYFFAITKKFAHDLDPKGKYIYKNFDIKHTTNVQTYKTPSHYRPNSLVFAGAIDFNMDFDPLLLALQKLKDHNISFSLDIYGEGKKILDLRTKIKFYGLEKHITFKGLVDNIKLNNTLPSYMIGLAPYSLKGDKNAPDHAFHGTDLTLKLVEYIASGLPVISTRLYKAFDIIETNKFGFLANTSDEWYDALYTLIHKKNLYQTYRENALSYAKTHDEENVLGNIFKKILP